MKIDYPVCIDCINFDMESEYKGRPVCKAYPLGIPDDVIVERSKPHAERIKQCSNGYNFESDKPVVVFERV